MKRFMSHSGIQRSLSNLGKDTEKKLSFREKIVWSFINDDQENLRFLEKRISQISLPML
jgi:hypothetical protein